MPKAWQELAEVLAQGHPIGAQRKSAVNKAQLNAIGKGKLACAPLYLFSLHGLLSLFSDNSSRNGSIYNRQDGGRRLTAVQEERWPHGRGQHPQRRARVRGSRP